MDLELNMGNKDRTIRTVAATVIVSLAAAGVLKGKAAKILLGFSAIFISTSFKGWCPLYAAVGTNSITEREKMQKQNEKVFDIL